MRVLRGIVQVIAFVVFGIIGAAGVQAQTTWYVDDDNCPGPGTGTLGDPFCSIQDGIDGAANTDIILVSPGTYNELINLLGKAIEVLSTDGPDATTINGTGLGDSVVKCIGGEGPDTMLDGFTITDGNATAGGGMYNTYSSPTISDCIFYENHAYSGGGMYNTDNSSPAVANCTFRGNSAGEEGGGMSNDHSNPTLMDCTFSDNWTGAGGGGAMINIDASPELTRCTFTGNTTGGGGGALQNWNSGPTLLGCIFVDNTAMTPGGDGGAIENAASNPLCINCAFAYNRVGDAGGAISSETGSTPVMTNCTFVGNEANTGGAIANHGGGESSLANCILWDNTAISEDPQIHTGGGTVTVTYSNIQGGWTNGDCPAEYPACNIDDDPLFVPGPAGCFYLSQTAAGQAQQSPCVDAGSDTAANLGFDTLTTRTDEVTDQGTVDMGYHYREDNGATPDCNENGIADECELDTDDDGDIDACDDDDDNDGVADESDTDPLDPYACEDVDGDTCDDCAWGVDGFGPLPDNNPAADGPDTDGDGICNAGDNCDLYNPDQTDCRPNGIGDVCDLEYCTGEAWCDDCNDNDVPDDCDIAGATSTDTNDDGVPDECVGVPAPPLPEDSLGITDCTIDDDCAQAAKCVDSICYAPKHRYISIARNPEQVENTARRIILEGGAAGPWWVGTPYQAPGFTVADVVDEPVYADADFTGEWPDLVNVTGCEIAPNQTYLVQAIPMGAQIMEEANYSAPIALHTPELWGDVVSTCMYYNCQPPDGEVNIDDILAGIAAFQSKNNDPLTWFDIAPAFGDGVPNQMVDIDDILANIQGFQSKAYPGLGPLDCP